MHFSPAALHDALARHPAFRDLVTDLAERLRLGRDRLFAAGGRFRLDESGHLHVALSTRGLDKPHVFDLRDRLLDPSHGPVALALAEGEMLTLHPEACDMVLEDHEILELRLRLRHGAPAAA